MKRVLIRSVVMLLGLVSIGEQAIAQVIPDNTVGTQVTQTGAMFGIDGGTRSGNNLFHSFSQFSVPTGGAAIFNNATDVQNIFSRVTGNSISNIDGLIKANGTASLFLMNPNGIVFGPNATLNLGGSFIGTTASVIKFEDGLIFDTLNATPPLLSVKVPIGLQMGTNPGAIAVQDDGHTLVTLLPRSIPVPTLRDPNNTGLTVATGKTLALVGREIDLTGGILTAEQGRIELGAVRSGTVRLDLKADQSIGLNYVNALTYGNLQLDQRSLVDVSGKVSGSIALQGQNLSLSGGSIMLNQNLGSQAAGITRINAIESIHVRDSIPTAQTAIRSEALGAGIGARIEVNTKQLIVQSGADITAASYGQGSVGVLQINVADRLEVNGFTPAAPFIISGIGSNTFGDGKGSQMYVNAPTIEVLKGGVIGSIALGTQQGSDLTIKASDILVSGVNSVIQVPSTITATTFGPGNGGYLMITTDRIMIRDIGIIASSTLASGSAGDFMLRASQWIETNGVAASINSAADRLSPIFQSAFGLPAIPTGNSGNITITTPQLRILNGSEVSVRSDGPGRSGILTIATDSIVLNNRGRITASTVSGNGGNIDLNVKSSLFMRNGSTIANNSFGIGDGGKTKINAPVILGLGNSDITANAISGQGGTIQITTQGLFGLQYRNALTPENDITASSEFGISGNVQVNTIGINPTNALNALPVDITDSSRQIADRCGAAKTSSFIATGRGGMPQGPLKKWGSDRPWHDLRPNAATNLVAIQPLANSQPLIEASAFAVDKTGAIALVAAQSIEPQPAATCGMRALN
jgi:filamentous hemagglutinin family protein